MSKPIWEQLTSKQQHALLLRLASRWIKRRKFYGFRGVGPGWRTLTSESNVKAHQSRTGRLSKSFKAAHWRLHHSPGGGKRILTQQTCLRFLVDKKGEFASGILPIPSQVIAYVQIRGKRRRCLVPTDVDQTLRGSPHGQDYVFSTLAKNSKEVFYECGWPCCLVTVDSSPNQVFALGCNHAFTLSGRNNWRPLFAGVQNRKTGVNGPVMGVPQDATDLNPDTGKPGFDAALILLTDINNLPKSFRNLNITGYLASSVMPYEATLYTPRGIPLRVVISGYHISMDLDYREDGNTSTFTIGPVIEYTAYPMTQKGDSGSPIMDDDGVLCGMHIYGYESGVGLAHPAISLFSPKRFISGRLKLIPQ